MEVAVEGSGALASVLDLATVPLPPINFSGDVTVTPYVQLRLLLNGTADAAARVSVVAPFRVGAAFSKQGRRRTDLSSDPQFDAEVGMPQVSGNFDGTVELEVTTTFLVAIQGIAVGGPVVGTRFGAHLHHRFGDVDLDARRSGQHRRRLGVPDPATLLPDVPDDLPEREFPPGTSPAARSPIRAVDALVARLRRRERRQRRRRSAGGRGRRRGRVGRRTLAGVAGSDSVPPGVPRWQNTGTRGGIPKAMPVPRTATSWWRVTPASAARTRSSASPRQERHAGGHADRFRRGVHVERDRGDHRQRHDRHRRHRPRRRNPSTGRRGARRAGESRMVERARDRRRLEQRGDRSAGPNTLGWDSRRRQRRLFRWQRHHRRQQRAGPASRRARRSPHGPRRRRRSQAGRSHRGHVRGRLLRDRRRAGCVRASPGVGRIAGG